MECRKIMLNMQIWKLGWVISPIWVTLVISPIWVTLAILPIFELCLYSWEEQRLEGSDRDDCSEHDEALHLNH